MVVVVDIAKQFTVQKNTFGALNAVDRITLLPPFILIRLGAFVSSE